MYIDRKSNASHKLVITEVMLYENSDLHMCRVASDLDIEGIGWLQVYILPVAMATTHDISCQNPRLLT